MTQLLQQAIAELQKLSDPDQNAMAAIILAEIADDKEWDDAFANSQDGLSQMAAKTREDIAAERVRDLGIDEL